MLTDAELGRVRAQMEFGRAEEGRRVGMIEDLRTLAIDLLDMIDAQKAQLAVADAIVALVERCECCERDPMLSTVHTGECRAALRAYEEVRATNG